MCIMIISPVHNLLLMFLIWNIFRSTFLVGILLVFKSLHYIQLMVSWFHRRANMCKKQLHCWICNSRECFVTAMCVPEISYLFEDQDILWIYANYVWKYVSMQVDVSPIKSCILCGFSFQVYKICVNILHASSFPRISLPPPPQYPNKLELLPPLCPSSCQVCLSDN